MSQAYEKHEADTPAPEQDPAGPSVYRVLVVEDEDDIRETLADVLTAEGYHVRTAHNGQEGLERLREHQPDLVLLDLMMPVMNGWDFITQVRATPEFQSTPVIAVSAANDPRSKRSFNGFLQKPFDLDVLLGTVQRFCEAAA